MKLNTFKYARQDEHKLSHLEIPLIMSPSEDGRKWSVSLLLGFLPLLIIPFLIRFFSHFTFLCSCSWANIPSKTSLFTAALNLSLSFLFMKMDLSFPPVASFYCVGSVSFLSPSHLEQTKSSGLQWAYYLLRQPPSHSLFFGDQTRCAVLSCSVVSDSLQPHLL